METITRMYVRLSNRIASSRGQTMGEYALIMGAIAVIAYGAYQLLGSNISTVANSVALDI